VSPRKRGEDGDLPEGFEEFWSAYPRKASKPQAIKAWKKQKLTRKNLPDILAGLERVRGSDQWQRDNGQYIPHPATWLNNRRWEDIDPLCNGSRASPASGGFSMYSVINQSKEAGHATP